VNETTTDVRGTGSASPVAGQRVVVDSARCQAYGICVTFHPGVFDLPANASTAVVLRENIEDDDRDDVREAILACPARAIALKSRNL
jgi:ferredoxin